MSDLISRQAAIDALMEILDRPNHADFLYTDEICKALKTLPSVQPDIMEKILAAGKEGREVRIYIGGRLFAVRELAQ